MKDSDKHHVKQAILARLGELEHHGLSSQGSRETVELDQQSVGRLSRMDAIERKAMADATQRLRQTEMQQLKAALKRLEDDEFGYCVDCGEVIEDKRLAHSLTVLKCMDCARG